MVTILGDVNDVFMCRRQQGHTEAIIRGAVSVPNSTIVVGNKDTEYGIRNRVRENYPESNVEVITVFELHKLIGCSGPVLIDNSVFHIMEKDIVDSIVSKVEGEWLKTVNEFKERIKELEFQLASSLILSKGTEIGRSEDEKASTERT